MGGAVQSFSSPMLAQGMQGGLSGFGTSGLQTFADGGQTTTIQDILAKYKAMESAKPKQDPTTEFLNKSWEGKNIDDYVMYSDKYKRGGKMAKGGIFEHGLQEGDKIVKQVDDKYLIVASKGGVYSVVDIEKGSRFIVGLDDSKTSGKRKSVKAGVKEAMEYINYVKSTKMANGGKFAQGGMLEDAKIYVADLAEYNNGRLVGKWLDLSDYSSGAEVMEAIQEMLDEQTKKDKYGDVHEEYAIHDFEGFPRSFYSEYMGESDFDQLYEIARVADDANLPLDVLMEAMSDLGYEDNAERVAEAYYSSVPANMGNEFRDFAYEYIDSIGGIESAVSNPESYFDFESFGSDAKMDYSEEELEEMGYNELSDEELGEQLADEVGGANALGEKILEMYFDYDKFARELEYDFIAVRGKDGDYYFFNRNFAKGGKVKYAKGGEVKNTRYRVLVRNSSSNEFREGAYFIEASSKEKVEEIALAKFKKEFGTKRGVSVFVHSIKEVPMENGKERTRKYFVKMRNRNGSEKDIFIIDAFEETTALRRAFSKFRKKYNRPSAFDDNQEEFSIAIDDIYPIDEIKQNGETIYKRTFAKGGEISSQKIYEVEYEIGGKKHTSEYMLYENDRVEKMLPPTAKIISIKEKLAKGGEVEDELIEYTIPTWALSSLINGDDSGLKDEDIEKIDKFVAEVVDTYGNANFMLGEESEESHFSYFNDIDRLGSDVTILYIRPSKKYAKGGEVEEINIAKQYGKMLNDLSKEKQFNKKIELNSKVKNFEKQNEISIDQNNIIYIKGNRVAYIDKINSKTGQQKTNWEIKKFAKGGEVYKSGTIPLKEFPIGFIIVLQERYDDYIKADKLLKKHGIKIDPSKNFHTKGFADELTGEFNDGRETYILKFNMFDAPNPKALEKDMFTFERKNPQTAISWSQQYAKGGEVDKITPELNQKITKRAEEIYKQDGGKSQSDFDKAMNKAIVEYGFKPSSYHSAMMEIGADYDDADGYYAKGGKIGFEGLAKKVAKRYVGKKVSKEYQAEYGKTYDAKEAKEVGNKVAGKVYKQQVAKKKIVRKLQRKTK